jgi:RNA polymerase sporulation-specific sigma factor
MENQTLVRLSKRGSETAKEALVKNNSGLIWSIAKRFSDRGYDIEDIFQIGCIGFIKAIDRFDFSYGTKFSTYAVPYIMGEIQRFLRDDGLIKVSRSLKDISAKISDIREKALKNTGSEPTVSELCSMLGLSRETVLMATESAKPVFCLDSPVSEDGDTSLSDMLSDDLGVRDKTDEFLNLKIAISKLNKDEREFVYMRFFEEKTQKEIAGVLNVSQVQICRREKKILEKLKENISA